jgi:putative tryptophan/tyrosine transport system substrate-binding protein
MNRSKQGDMGIKTTVVLLVGLALASVHIAEAQQPPKVAKIGWLSARSSSVPGPELFRPALRELGYIEGKNIAIEYRYADNKFDRLPVLADELVNLKVEVLLTPSTIEAVVAKNAYQDDSHRFFKCG